MAWPDAIQRLDESILVAAHASPSWIVDVLYGFTVIGGGWAMLALIPFFVVKRGRRFAIGATIAIVLQSGLVSLVKWLVERPRPCVALGWCAPLLGPTPQGPSFPSGHAAGSFAFAAFVAVYCARELSKRDAALATGAALAFAILVASSRVVLGVHYPSDVVGGALLGASVGATTARLLAARWRPTP